MKVKASLKQSTILIGIVAAVSVGTSFGALAYDGQHCKEAGVCWEAQPGYPEKIAGSKYDVKALEDPHEVAKQGTSEKAMEARNAKRVAYFKKSGKWVYDVDQIPQ
ncbi:MAG: methanol dehydrogenase [Methylovirgula sp.]